MDFEPAYLGLLRSGELLERVDRAWRQMHGCDLCARACRVDRLKSAKGAVCRTGKNPIVSSAHPHFGEEEPLSGHRGSGTIFFSYCNLKCVFCQNWEISWRGEGMESTPRQLADQMLHLQNQGCHNINLVSPSHVIAPILAAVALAADDGLRLPLVYNSGGYDSPSGLALLDGVVDIYMPDVKWGEGGPAHRYSGARDYPIVNRDTLREMHRQVGDLQLDENGIARRGLLVRHLVMPGGLAATERIFRFLAEEISRDTYLNVMSQYRPCYKAARFPALNRSLSREDFQSAVELADRMGLHRLDQRRRAWFLF